MVASQSLQAFRMLLSGPADAPRPGLVASSSSTEPNRPGMNRGLRGFFIRPGFQFFQFFHPGFQLHADGAQVWPVAVRARAEMVIERFMGIIQGFTHGAYSAI